jgi:hypothetical protein
LTKTSSYDVINKILYLMNFIKTKGDKKMKVLVRLAVVVAILLMVSNVAVAGSSTCTGDQVVCYKVTISYDTGSTLNNIIYGFCLNDDGTGAFCQWGDECASYFKAFGGGTGWYNFDGAPQHGENPNWSLWVANNVNGWAGIYQPIGEGNLLTGVQTYGPTTNRAIVNGIRIPCP